MTTRREKIFTENLKKIQRIARLYANIWDYQGLEEISASPLSDLIEQKFVFTVKFRKHDEEGIELVDVTLNGKRLGYNFGKKLKDDIVEELAANALHRACFMYEVNYQRKRHKNFFEKLRANA